MVTKTKAVYLFYFKKVDNKANILISVVSVPEKNFIINKYAQQISFPFVFLSLTVYVENKSASLLDRRVTDVITKIS